MSSSSSTSSWKSSSRGAAFHINFLACLYYTIGVFRANIGPPLFLMVKNAPLLHVLWFRLCPKHKKLTGVVFWYPQIEKASTVALLCDMLPLSQLFQLFQLFQLLSVKRHACHHHLSQLFQLFQLFQLLSVKRHACHHHQRHHGNHHLGGPPSTSTS